MPSRQEPGSKYGFFIRLNQIRLIFVNIMFYSVLALILLLFWSGVLGGSLALFESDEAPSSGSVLYVDPTGYLFEDAWWSDTESYDPDDLPDSYYFDLTEALRLSLDDKNIDSVILDLGSFYGGDYPQLAEIATLLKKHREKGNRVVAYGYSYSQAGYYIASAADKVYLDRRGELVLPGFSIQSLFYGELAKRFKLDVEIFRAGDYKSAVEPWLGSGFSESSKMNLSVWLNELWSRIEGEIAINRDLKPEAVKRYSREFEALMRENGYSDKRPDAGIAARTAWNNGMVDDLLSLPIIYGADDIMEAAGISGSAVNYLSYIGSGKEGSGRSVGVLSVEGAITTGNPLNPGVAGSSRFYDQVQAVFSNDDVKAVVLRINSPGGSAFAAEQMRETVRAAADDYGKPLVVSMGGQAASGGFWLAMAGDEVFADPGTITGSIGVYSIVPTFQRTLSEYLGVTVDGVSTGGLGFASPVSAMSDQQKFYYQSSVNSIYDWFLALVEESREMKRKQLLPLAGGRVFTGRFAQEQGLVDSTGSFYDAVEAAAELAELKRYRVDFNKREKSMMEKLGDEMMKRMSPIGAASAGTPAAFTLAQLKQFGGLIELSQLSDPGACYAWNPVSLHWWVREKASFPAGSSLRSNPESGLSK